MSIFSSIGRSISRAVKSIGNAIGRFVKNIVNALTHDPLGVIMLAISLVTIGIALLAVGGAYLTAGALALGVADTTFAFLVVGSLGVLALGTQSRVLFTLITIGAIAATAILMFGSYTLPNVSWIDSWVGSMRAPLAWFGGHVAWQITYGTLYFLAMAALASWAGGRNGSTYAGAFSSLTGSLATSVGTVIGSVGHAVGKIVGSVVGAAGAAVEGAVSGATSSLGVVGLVLLGVAGYAAYNVFNEGE